MLKGTNHIVAVLAALLLGPAGCDTGSGAGDGEIIDAGLADIEIDAEVSRIVSEKCADCHSVKLIESSDLTYAHYLGGCAACHAPLSEDHERAGCTATDCHTKAAESHFNLRAENDQTTLRPDVEGECLVCHAGNLNAFGKGFPPLTTNREIAMYADQGTLRQWIQPGGAMAKYLNSDEADHLTAWIDERAAKRTLPYDPTIDATKIDADFELNGRGDDPAWAAAEEHVVTLTATPISPQLSDVLPLPQVESVTLTALVSNDYLYIKAEYEDPSFSLTGPDAWLYDPSGNTWRHPPQAEIYSVENAFIEILALDQALFQKQSEDRLGFVWNMTVPDFKTTYGCAVKCHGNAMGSSCFLDGANDTADLWIAKPSGGLGVRGASQNGAPPVLADDESFQAQSGDFTFLGHADDGHLTAYMNLEGGYNTRTAGRIGDTGTPARAENVNGTGTAPIYMESAPVDYIDGMVLTQAEIDEGQAIVSAPEHPGYAGAAAVFAAWEKYQAVNAIVPERISAVPSDSRADLAHGASWKDGLWIHEFKRKRVTEHTDDLQFAGPGEYEFSVTIFNNAGSGEVPPNHNTYGNGQYLILKID